MDVGMSVFIPAVDLFRLKDQVTKESYTLGITLKGMNRIEGGKLGMRFWRIL